VEGWREISARAVALVGDRNINAVPARQRDWLIDVCRERAIGRHNDSSLWPRTQWWPLARRPVLYYRRGEYAFQQRRYLVRDVEDRWRLAIEQIPGPSRPASIEVALIVIAKDANLESRAEG